MVAAPMATDKHKRILIMQPAWDNKANQFRDASCWAHNLLWQLFLAWRLFEKPMPLMATVGCQAKMASQGKLPDAIELERECCSLPAL